MKNFHKLLVSILTAVVLTGFGTSTVFASELTTSSGQTAQDTTEATVNIQNNTEDQSSEAEAEDIQATTEEDGTVIEDKDALINAEADTNGSAEDGTYVEEDTEEVVEATEVSEEEEKEAKVKKPSYSEEDLRLLACLVYSEAGNQSYNGMLAVANVVLNRVKSDAYWHADTIKEVIYDKKWAVQFAVTIKNSKGVSTLDKALKSYDTGKFSGSNAEAQKKSMNQAIKAAKAALNGKNNIGSFLCFQNKRSASSIKKKYSDYKIIGDHIFYRTK